MEMSYIAKSRAIVKMIFVTSNPSVEDFESAAQQFDSTKNHLKLPIVSQVSETCYSNPLLESMSFHQVWNVAINWKSHILWNTLESDGDQLNTPLKTSNETALLTIWGIIWEGAKANYLWSLGMLEMMSIFPLVSFQEIHCDRSWSKRNIIDLLDSVAKSIIKRLEKNIASIIDEESSEVISLVLKCM